MLLPASIKNLNSFVLNEAVTDSLAVVLKKYLLNSYSDKNVFQAMFKNRNITDQFSCGSTKCANDDVKNASLDVCFLMNATLAL